jgi:hypothetical protein
MAGAVFNLPSASRSIADATSRAKHRFFLSLPAADADVGRTAQS